VPRPVKVGARWIPAGGGDAIANPLVPLPRVLPDMASTRVEVPLEVPDQPGPYVVRVALRQPGRGWFGVRIQAEVEVVAEVDVEVEPAGLARLGPQRREQHDVADAGRVGEQHDQAVHADAEAAGGR